MFLSGLVKPLKLSNIILIFFHQILKGHQLIISSTFAPKLTPLFHLKWLFYFKLYAYWHKITNPLPFLSWRHLWLFPNVRDKKSLCTQLWNLTSNLMSFCRIASQIDSFFFRVTFGPNFENKIPWFWRTKFAKVLFWVFVNIFIDFNFDQISISF